MDNVEMIEQRVMKFSQQLLTIFENGWSFLCFSFIQCLIFFSPIKLNIYTVGFLIVVDVFTALIALFMMEKKNHTTVRAAFASFYTKWTSKRAFDSIPKFVWYSLLVLLAYLIGSIYEEALKTANLATGVIAYVEVRSIIENGDKAFGTNLWELVVDSVKKFFKLK